MRSSMTNYGIFSLHPLDKFGMEWEKFQIKPIFLSRKKLIANEHSAHTHTHQISLADLI